MNVLIYSTHKFEMKILLTQNEDKHNLKFLDLRLNEETAYLANGSAAVCIFVNDDASGKILDKLHGAGIKYIALRSAGYN
ncbi:MAG: 2-hydroxyacid dehydrogenase, partial [Bacteroidota bacterium]|nr:2-hydroxyacid dehydrogenase [Bacteroidota bacterium]